MSNSRKTAATGGGGGQGISVVIQGSDTGSPYFWFRVMVNSRRGDEGSGGHSCGVPELYQGGADKEAGRQVMGYTGG